MLAPLPQTDLGQLQAPKFHDVTIKRKYKTECARVCPVPPEEFGISSKARRIQDSGYCFHAVRTTVGDLLAEGYDPEQVKTLPTSRFWLNSEQTARDTVDETSYDQGQQSFDNTARQVLIIEHYIYMDYEKNGKPAIYKIVSGEEFEPIYRKGEPACERMDYFPFAAMTPVIMTHRFWGRSIADLVIDIMKIKTALVRGLLDNLYMRNNFRTEVSEAHASDNTIDDLLIARPGGIVRTKQPGGLNPLQVEDVSAAIYPALQYFDATREWRSGVSRQGQGIDPNALQNQVATIANQMEQMSDKKVKLIARIFAETGIRDLFGLLHAVIRKHGSKAQTVRLRNQWVNVDPREWKARDDMTIKVALGSGNKVQQMAGIQQIIQAQIQGVQAGLVSRNNLWHTAQALCKVLGYPDASEFFVDPTVPMNPQDQNAAPIPPPPDPKQSEIQAKAQAEQAKMQADAAHQKMKTEADISFQQYKANIDAQLAAQKATIQAHLEQQKLALDVAKADHDAMIKQKELDIKAQPKAQIQVQHDAPALTGPLADMLGQFGQSMQQMMAEHQARHQEAIARHEQANARHAELMGTMTAHMTAPKRVVRGKDGRVSHVETVTH